MTHFNRKNQLLNTLRSIQRQIDVKDLCEIIIVDDVSETPLKYEDFNEFDLDIKLVTIQTKNKWWVNPVVGFNTAFSFISGEKTIIQNAECLHKTDIIKYVLDNLKQNEYIAMSTISIPQTITENLNSDTNLDEVINQDGCLWYCHPVHRADPFNFCSAIHTSDLRKIGGFNLDFSDGIWFDDNDFVERIRKNQIDIRIEVSQLAIHQWHESVWTTRNDFNELMNVNRLKLK
jgi:GT2 family glycosyltransferase